MSASAPAAPRDSSAPPADDRVDLTPPEDCVTWRLMQSAFGMHAPMTALRVIAAAVVDTRGLLLVSKRAATDIYFLPGGKPEPEESPYECLCRELREELGVGLTWSRHFAEVDSRAALEPAPLRMTVFLAGIDGPPRPAAEVADVRYWDGGSQLRIAPAVADHVIPQLRRARLFSPQPAGAVRLTTN
jgi:8-oxo-dGTP diphosphatase